MWTFRIEADSTAHRDDIWYLISDVSNWRDWSSGIDGVELKHPFAAKKEDIGLANGMIVSMRNRDGVAVDLKVGGLFSGKSFSLSARVNGFEILHQYGISSTDPFLNTLSSEITISSMARTTQHSQPNEVEFGNWYSRNFNIDLGKVTASAERLRVR